MWRDRAERHLPALAGYVVLVAAFFSQVLAHINTRILSDGRDGATFLWGMWALPKELFSGHNPFVTDLMFHPVGARLGFHTSIPLESFLSAPAAKVVGFAAATNLVRLAAAVIAGFGAYLLAYHECRQRLPAFVAGAAFALAPYQIANSYGHFNLQQTQFLPLGVLALLLLYERPTRLRALATGLALAACVWTDLYYTFFLLFAWALIVVWHLRATMRRQFLAKAAEAAGYAAVLSAPMVYELVRELVKFNELDRLRNWGQAELYSADLLSWVVPPHTHPWWGATFANINERVSGGDRMAFPGFVILALAIVGAVWGGSRRRHLWTVMALGFAILSFGPFLHVNGWQGSRFDIYDARFSIPMPFAALRFVPVINGVRTPGRFSIMTMLALSVLSALALARLGRRYPRARTAIGLGALAVVLLEFLPGHLPFQPASAPRPYRAIAHDPGRRAVLELPLVVRWGFGALGNPAVDANIHLFYATKHGKPVVSGFHARYPQWRVQELESIPLVRQVFALQGDRHFRDAPTFGVDDLRHESIGYVVYHRDNPQPKALEYFSRLHLPVLADDGNVTVWKVPAAK